MQKVLVIDDEFDIGILMKAMLRSAGVEVKYARNLAMANYLLNEMVFDKIFLDLNLGKEHGLSLLPSLRTLESAPEVIVITAQYNDDVVGRLREENIEKVIEKPFNKQQILSALRIGNNSQNSQ